MFGTERFYIAMVIGLLASHRDEDKGAAMVEYALLVAGIAVVVGAAALAFGGRVATLFGGLTL